MLTTLFDNLLEIIPIIAVIGVLIYVGWWFISKDDKDS